MASKKLLVSLVAALALAVLLIANVSADNVAFADITSLEVNGVDAFSQTAPIAVFAGESIPVKVIFKSLENAQDVRVKAWIAGDRELASVSEKFDAIDNNTYSKTISVKVPSNLDNLAETLELNVIIENRNQGIGDGVTVELTLERQSYNVEILDANMVSEITAGDVLTVDTVVKNRGRYFADDSFVKVSIPALKIENRVFIGDISSIDEPFSSNPFEAEDNEGFDRLDKEDAAQGRVSLRIPSDAPAGLYIVEITSFNDDSEATVTKKLVVRGAEANTMVTAPVHSKSLKVGENGEYSLVLVNSGNNVEVFELVIESPNDLKIDVSEPIVALQAGSSKTVKLTASADKEGTYNFAVNVHSGTELVKRESFTADVKGSESISAGNPAVLLTVVLAVIFVVLLIVLIVLLTRKPEKSEELGESYY